MKARVFVHVEDDCGRKDPKRNVTIPIPTQEGNALGLHFQNGILIGSPWEVIKLNEVIKHNMILYKEINSVDISSKDVREIQRSVKSQQAIRLLIKPLIAQIGQC